MEPVELRHRDQLPAGLLEAEASDLGELLGGPTVFHLDGGGEADAPMFVAVLLHGNEVSGWEAVRLLLQDLDGRLPRPLTLLCGNLAAARANARQLEGVEDYNRIWRPDSGSPLGRDFWRLRERLRERGVCMAMDLHNTNGKNPAHALCMAHAGPGTRELASGFAGLVLLAEHRLGSCMEAFDAICPSVTIECGRPGDPEGIERARAYLHQVVSGGIPRSADARFYRLLARVLPVGGLRVGVGNGGADISLPDDAEEWNMRLVPQNGFLAHVPADCPRPVQALSPGGEDLADRFFVNNGGELRAARALMPAMITHESDKVRQDCLCYLMEEARPEA